MLWGLLGATKTTETQGSYLLVLRPKTRGIPGAMAQGSYEVLWPKKGRAANPRARQAGCRSGVAPGRHEA